MHAKDKEQMRIFNIFKRAEKLHPSDRAVFNNLTWFSLDEEDTKELQEAYLDMQEGKISNMQFYAIKQQIATRRDRRERADSNI